MNKIILFLLTAFLLFISCTKEIEIEIPEQEPNLVIYSTIEPLLFPHPKSLRVSLQQSAHISDTARYPVNDALILYYENDSLKDTLKCVDSTGIYPITKGLGDYPVQGNSYAIKVLKDGFENVTAKTTIPPKVMIKDTVVTPIAYFDEDGGVFSEVSVTFADPGNETNFYELAISDIAYSYDKPHTFYRLSTYDKIITSESYYPSLLRFDLKQPRVLLFNDKEINGKEHTLNVYYIPPQRESEYRYISHHYISIHLRNVTEEYYRFKTSMLQHLYNKEEDILYGMGEPLNVISNINNGYGLFAGYNSDIVSIFIKEKIIND